MMFLMVFCVAFLISFSPTFAGGDGATKSKFSDFPESKVLMGNWSGFLRNDSNPAYVKTCNISVSEQGTTDLLLVRHQLQGNVGEVQACVVSVDKKGRMGFTYKSPRSGAEYFFYVNERGKLVAVGDGANFSVMNYQLERRK